MLVTPWKLVNGARKKTLDQYAAAAAAAVWTAISATHATKWNAPVEYLERFNYS
jgi:hypothetical protein